MHAYLVTGNDINARNKKAQGLGKSFGQDTLEFTIKKIDEVRELSKFLKLRVVYPTSIIIKDVHEATTEALNAFLKNLEEPQKNVYFILTTTSETKVIPTIVSRCQVIRINSPIQSVRNSDIEGYLNAPINTRFRFIETLRKKEQAKEFVENLIFRLHEKLLTADGNINSISNSIKLSQQALNALNSNANLVIQLTNLSINLEKFEFTG